jgi:transcriptional regulator with XRE-family HTH domain
MTYTDHNRMQQIELYGEPLGDKVRRIGDTLGLTQARLAETIGLSAPMLSQLMSAQRVKIGNPAVVSRLQSLDDLFNKVVEQGLENIQLTAELNEIKAATGAFTKSVPTANITTPPAARTVVREIQDLLRAAASADEIQRAAAKIVADSPGLAEFLLAYGAGRTDDAVAHYERNH